jgi:hypothetical protein
MGTIDRVATWRRREGSFRRSRFGPLSHRRPLRDLQFSSGDCKTSEPHNWVGQQATRRRNSFSMPGGHNETSNPNRDYDARSSSR